MRSSRTQAGGRHQLLAAARALAAARLRHHWDCVVTAEEAGYYKPDPHPYRWRSPLGVEADDAAFVAGSGYDLFGTVRVGLRTYWHNRVGLPRPAGAPPPEIESNNLDGLVPWLEGSTMKKRLLLPLAALLRRLAGRRAGANRPKSFPAPPITLIVPFPAGGPSDALARALGAAMAANLANASSSKTSPAPAAPSA